MSAPGQDVEAHARGVGELDEKDAVARKPRNASGTVPNCQGMETIDDQAQ